MRRLREALNERYVSARGIETGIDPAVRDRQLLRFVYDKAVAKANAAARRYPQAFISPGVRLINRQSLVVGTGVSIARGVVIDAMSRDGVRLADAATVDVGAVIRGSGGIRRLGVGVAVGPRAAIGAFNFIHGGGGVIIGADVLLGPYVQIFSENHVFGDLSRPIIEQGEAPGLVSVGRGAWVGANSVILAGVTIGEDAVVAAGSVVTKDVPASAIVGGNPAKLIRMRGDR
ncbi:hypothetical protein GCM10023349_28870 [Nocardioides conyzicola]|uniref:Acyltransferase n=1 Tax=Nocardioides conyzicola TaxID=1651781 RepID=A0ABP8XIR3_9ACTN